jgi:hypothetical protein
MLRPMIASLLLGAVLATTGTLLTVYFEREPSRAASGLTTGPTVADPNAAARAIPPPEPPVEKAGGPTVITTDDLPTVTSAPRAMRPELPTSAVGATAGEAPTVAPVMTAAPVVAPRGPRAVDKSEVF